MAYKNHQSAQLGIEQSVLLYTFGFARNSYQDVCGLQPGSHARYAARSYPRMWPKAKIEFTVSFLYSRVTQNTKINLYTKI